MRLIFLVETLNDAASAAWVTVIVLAGTPFTETVIIANLELEEAFAAAVAVIVCLFVPEAGETVNQDSELLSVQFTLDVIVNVPVLFAGAAIFKESADISSTSGFRNTQSVSLIGYLRARKSARRSFWKACDMAATIIVARNEFPDAVLLN